MEDLVAKDINRRLLLQEQEATTFRLAIVTALSPLTIDIGDSGVNVPAKLVTPGGRGLLVGDLVAVLRWGKDLLVLGRILTAPETTVWTTTATTGGPSTTSAADPMTAVMAEMSITADFGARPLMIIFTGSGSLSGAAAANSGHIALYDGASEIGLSRRFLQSIGGGTNWHWATHALYTPPSGSRTITTRWRCGGGTLSGNSTNREMTIIRQP